MLQRIRIETKRLDQILDEKYFSREELHKHIKFPCSTSNLAIIPSNPKGTGFLNNLYN